MEEGRSLGSVLICLSRLLKRSHHMLIVGALAICTVVALAVCEYQFKSFRGLLNPVQTLAKLSNVSLGFRKRIVVDCPPKNQEVRTDKSFGQVLFVHFTEKQLGIKVGPIAAYSGSSLRSQSIYASIGVKGESILGWFRTLHVSKYLYRDIVRRGTPAILKSAQNVPLWVVPLSLDLFWSVKINQLSVYHFVGGSNYQFWGPHHAALVLDSSKTDKCSLDGYQRLATDLVGVAHSYQLQAVNYGDDDSSQKQPPIDNRVSWLRILLNMCRLIFWVGVGGCCSRYYFRHITNLILSPLLVLLLVALAFQCVQSLLAVLEDYNIVTQKYLTSCYLCNTVIDMANVLNTDKKIAVIGALAEGSSIRSIERITGVHRDTIMRLGVKVGQGCAAVMDSKMRNLPCNRLEMDEIWGFVGKKDRNVRVGENAVGSVWTFCAIDAETKLVPAFKVGERSAATAKAFVQDVADRMAYRVQISTDGLTAYVAAMESAFGGDVDYAQIIKTYGREETIDNRRYSAPEFVSSEKKIFVGNPDVRLISTSYIERLNATTRLHMRRLTRLTLAFSKKRENFEAAVALHFTYYNFVKRHSTIRCTPAMAAGVTSGFWSVGDLVEAAA